jgi:hypothetical protein
MSAAHRCSYGADVYGGASSGSIGTATAGAESVAGIATRASREARRGQEATKPQRVTVLMNLMFTPLRTRQ